MKQFSKIILIILIFIIVVILVDNIVAKVFNTSPILKIRENINDAEIERIDKGILVDTYILVNGTTKTIFKWEDYSKKANNIYTNAELEKIALDYFLANTKKPLERDRYSVGISSEVPDIYQGKNMVVIEIRHLNNGNNTLDARYYIALDTAKGYDDNNNVVDLKEE